MKSSIYKFFILVTVLMFCPLAGMGKTKVVKKKNDPASYLQQGKEAFYNYEFEKASEFFDDYRDSKKKLSEAEETEISDLENRLEIATRAFDRVQKVVVIDSISVPRSKFFQYYNLAPSTGKVGLPGDLGVNDVKNQNEVSYINENGDYFVTSVSEGGNDLRLKENRKLLDGSWETTEMLNGDIELNGNYNYPYLNGDGQTFYFANDGEESMGGYDLFVVQKEPISGESLQPLNLGMPFNSPYDDFLLVTDDENGVGWWATDRNSPGGDVTIYVYLLEEVRKNYSPDTENLSDFARLSNYKATQDPGKEKEYSEILNKIRGRNK